MVRLRRLVARARTGPLLVLAGGALLVAIGAGLIAAHVTAWALDETLIEQSAVHYTAHLPHSLLHDIDARATSRLYPLVLSIAFRLFNGAQAIRVDHVLSVVLFVSTFVPVYLMGRVLLRSKWAAVGAALLSVAVPWLTITSALFEENLAYPLFWWAMLACCHAVWQPRARSDTIAVGAIAALIATRVEFASMLVAYLVAASVVSIWRAQPNRGILSRVWVAARTDLRRYPLTVAICLVGVPVLVYVALATPKLEEFLGTYSNVVYRQGGLPPNMSEALLLELIALALGVGLLPAIVSIPWYLRRVVSSRLDRAGVYLVGTGIMLAIFAALAAFSQGGYLGAGSEERYFFYVIPVFWLGAFAVVEERGLRASEIVVCSVALAALYGAIPFLAPLNHETAFLAPVESVVPHVLDQRLANVGLQGLSIQDLLAVAVVLAGVLTALVWRRWRRARLFWTLGGAAVLQLLITGYAFAVIDGKLPGLSGRTSGSVDALGWVDAHAHVADVTWLENSASETPPPGGPSPLVTRTRNVLFWNSHLLSWAWLPQLGLPQPDWPLVALPQVAALEVDRATGELTPQAQAPQLREIVGAEHSPFLQLAGATLAQSPEGHLALMAPAMPVRATWIVTGLQPNGALLAGHPAHLAAFNPAPSASAGTSRGAKGVTDSGGREAETITLTLSVPTPTPSAAGTAAGGGQHDGLVLRLGSIRRSIALNAAHSPTSVSVVACFGASDRVLRGRLAVIGGARGGNGVVGAVLDGVSIDPAPAPQAASCAR